LIFLDTRNREKKMLAVVWINGRRGENILWVCCCWVVIWVEKKKNGFVLVLDFDFGIFHQLPSGLNMEVIVQKGVGDKDPDERIERNSENPLLIFVHGSKYAAWCWAEH
jgi:hypothetical protein